MAAAADLPELIIPDRAAWRDWLHTNHDGALGVWLVLAKKATVDPTRLTYDEALEEALCYGWIDGQKGSRDAATFKQRFTRRRPKSPWSKRNVGIVQRLIADERMQPPGLAEIERAQADGRWDVAYEGSATAAVPDDFANALTANPTALAMFEGLSRGNRYAILYRIGAVRRPETRARKIDEFIAMLTRGETVHLNSVSQAESAAQIRLMEPGMSVGSKNTVVMPASAAPLRLIR
jgi:uncharacterized protein YdeI (YjbR/CyaY-like superfamily)